MQNKPNLLNAQMNVSSVLTKDYENKPIGNLAKTNPIQTQYKPNTKPIQSQYKPNFRKAKMNITSILTKDYENETAFALRQNKPNQTQLVVSLSNLFQTGYIEQHSRVSGKEFSIGSARSTIAQLLKNRNVRWSVLSF